MTVGAHTVPRRRAPSPIPPLTAEQALAILARALFREGYDDHHTGHITVRRSGEEFLSLPAQFGWSEVQASHVVTMDAEGRVTGGDWDIPPAIRLHVEYHRSRNATVVLHQHPRYGSVWSALGRVPPAYDQGSALVDTDDIAVVGEYFGDVTSAESARRNVEAVGDKHIALLAHHGVLVAGDNVQQAFSRAVQLEWRCRLAWRVEAVGGGVPLPRARQRELSAAHKRAGDALVGLWEWAVRRELRADPSVLD